MRLGKLTTRGAYANIIERNNKVTVLIFIVGDSKPTKILNSQVDKVPETILNGINFLERITKQSPLPEFYWVSNTGEDPNSFKDWLDDTD